MAVRLNDNKELVAKIKEGLEKKGGYCPCRLEKTEDNKCICREFRRILSLYAVLQIQRLKRLKNRIPDGKQKAVIRQVLCFLQQDR